MSSPTQISETAKDSVKKLGELKELVDLFRFNVAQYKGAQYDEANTRTDFIDKFFELLGWDVRNTAGYSEQYRDVIREDRVEIDNRSKAPDYAFRIGGYRKFFVEAKKPSVNIHHDIPSALQIRRYGYTAKLPLSILTNFAEFAVYDTRIKTHDNDKASTARIFYSRFDEYLEKSVQEGFETTFDFIAATFSKDAILKGSFDRYIQSTKNKRGTSEVDDDILAMVEEWRLTLAKNIARRNPQLDLFHLNEAVQRIVDRILFLRIAEDRHIEHYGNLLKAAEKTGIYPYLQSLFTAADEKYNAGLFRQETWLDQVIVEDKILAPIIKGLYYPKSHYAFNVLPIEILGSIYERFLGKTIYLSPGHVAKVEEKPEVRKVGGVYYTPQYIVDYIIQETVGRKIQEKTPSQISGLTVLDPACGSGSFLVGTYRFLLDSHLTYYVDKANRKKSLQKGVIYEAGPETFRLSIEEKQRILLGNIYGVDIDPIAVEVAKLSLYLKLLEHETEESRGRLFKYSDMKMLPNLDENIRCGNSLIERDFFQKVDLQLISDIEWRRINPFLWKEGFPAVVKNGGFDCVIGNPPWGQKAVRFTKEEKEYFERKYPSSSVGIPDLSRFFIEQSIRLLNQTGTWGQVLPDIILLKDYESTRRFLLENVHIQNINHWGKAFQQVNLEACTITGKKGGRAGKVQIRIHQKNASITERKVSQSVFAKLPGCKFNLFLTDASWKVIQRLSLHKKFSECFDVHEGVHSGNVREKLFVDHPLNKKCRKLIFGRDEVKRYYLCWNGQWVHYTKDFLCNGEYAGLGRPEYFETPKLVVRRTGDYVLAALDEKGYYFSNNVFICLPKKNLSLKFYLGLLNSRLMTWYYRTMQPRVGRIFAEIKINLINQFPVPYMNLSVKSVRASHDRLVALVDQILVEQSRFYGAKSPSDKRISQDRSAVLEEKIDRFIYELYGLTNEEIKIVEGR